MKVLAFLLVPTLSLGFPFTSTPVYSDSDDCSNIYCQGDILNDVQLSGLFSDSKSFVDKRLLNPVHDVLEEYNSIKSQSNGVVKKGELKKFLDKNFEDGEELEEWIPPDWVQYPSILSKISNLQLKEWAEGLNHVWKNLSRKITDDVRINPELYSLIYVPNGFVIPGGRFRELYYWDTYWIVSGLLKCDMNETAKGVIENLATLARTLGYVPNGNRVYYKGRSQPPMLTLMVNAYYEHTKDLSIIKNNIDALDKEMQFWLKKRAIQVENNGAQFTLFHYDVEVGRPRPESYKEDVETARKIDEKKRTEAYKDIRSAAESGWDFSTRWFILNGENHGNLNNIATRKIIPVDLNALLQRDFVLLSKMHKILGDKDKEIYYSKLGAALKTAITCVLWKEDTGIWLDFDTENNKSRDYLYLSNFVPLWTGSYDFQKSNLTQKILAYVEKNNLASYIGGVPTSLERSGEQWDYPNAWPPLQAFVIQGLERLGTPEATKKAFAFAQKWISTNYKSYELSGIMFEKYDVEKVGQTGGGGEYVPQQGFGWTNGVVFELLDKWGSLLKPDS